MSRLPKGAVVTRLSPATLRQLGALSIRSFQSSTAPQQSSAAATTTANDDGGLGSIMSKWGTIPTLGLLTGALLSKEIVLFNEEFLLFGVWGAFLATAYVGIGDQVHDSLQGMIEERQQRFDDIMDMYIEGVNVYKAKQQWQLDSVQVLEDMLKDERQMLEVSYAAKNLQLRNAAHAAMLAKLNSIKTQEDLAAAKANEELVEKCMAAVRADFAMGAIDAKTKAALLNTAIGNIGTAKLSGAEDPVKASFIKNLNL